MFMSDLFDRKRVWALIYIKFQIPLNLFQHGRAEVCVIYVSVIIWLSLFAQTSTKIENVHHLSSVNIWVKYILYTFYLCPDYGYNFFSSFDWYGSCMFETVGSGTSSLVACSFSRSQLECVGCSESLVAMYSSIFDVGNIFWGKYEAMLGLSVMLELYNKLPYILTKPHVEWNLIKFL